jgi:hypothetical protein
MQANSSASNWHAQVGSGLCDLRFHHKQIVCEGRPALAYQFLTGVGTYSLLHAQHFAPSIAPNTLRTEPVSANSGDGDQNDPPTTPLLAIHGYGVVDSLGSILFTTLCSASTEETVASTTNHDLKWKCVHLSLMVLSEASTCECTLRSSNRSAFVVCSSLWKHRSPNITRPAGILRAPEPRSACE